MPQNRDNRGANTKTGCTLCKEPDTDTMVACDRCNLWYHFRCVNVGESVADRDWSCPSCIRGIYDISVTNIGDDQLSRHSTTSSVRAARAALELQRLDEQKRLDMERIEAESRRKEQEAALSRARLQQEKAQREKEAELQRQRLEEERKNQEKEQALEEKRLEDEKQRAEALKKLEDLYLQRKYEILNAQLDESVSEKRSVSVNGAARARLWVDTCNLNLVPDEDVPNPSSMKQPEKETGAIPKQSQRKDDIQNLQPLHNSTPLAEKPYQPEIKQGDVAVVRIPQRSSRSEPTYQDRLPFLKPAEMPLNLPPSGGTAARFTRFSLSDRRPQDSGNDVQIPLTSDNQSRPHPRTAMQEISDLQPQISILSNAQLAARQVLTRDLPSFSGQPDDWPVFISCFEMGTRECGFSNAENLIRLQRSLKGPALEAVKSRLLLPNAVPRVIETLRMLYGRPDVLINSLLCKIRNTPSPKEGRLDSLINYCMAVQNYCDHLVAAGQEDHLSNPSLLQELVGKLPADIKLKWVDYKDAAGVMDLGTFGDFMADIMRKASEVTVYCPGISSSSKAEEARTRSSGQPTKGYYHHDSEDLDETKDIQRPNAKQCVICDKSGHMVEQCVKFDRFSPDERWKAVRLHDLCRSCLKNHAPWPCRRPKECSVSGCRIRHHPLLHYPSNNLRPTISSSQNHHSVGHKVIYRIIPVTVYGISDPVHTYALLDEGSEVTMIERSLADQLGLKGISDPLHLRWTGDVTRVESGSRVMNLAISGRGKAKHHELINARTVEKLELPVQSIKLRELVEAYPHLHGLPVEDYENARPLLLIGLENLYLAAPLKVREGPRGHPIATKTRLGWCIYGGQTSFQIELAHRAFHVKRTTKDQELHDLVKQYFLMDSLGITSTNVPLESVEDKRARSLLSSTTRRIPGGFETGILWKHDNVCFPNNYPMALNRWRSLERKINKDAKLATRVAEQISSYLEKGYARRATAEELAEADQDKIWFLPLGLVINPKKPDKLRLIWDAAAEVRGTSFNTMVLKGPDLLTPLPEVMYRFRSRRYAIAGDIKEMYHRFKIRPEDQLAQLFLYREEPNEEPTIFVMCSATFGSACSPCSAHYIKNLNAMDYQAEYPNAVEAIIKGHYVDDFLDSRDTIEEVVQLAEDVKFVHRQGGFEIRNFVSNSAEVRARLGESEAASIKEWGPDNNEDVQSILGLRWLPHVDKFTFSAPMLPPALLDGSIRPTKRQVLRVVMSLYDPLGFLAAFVIHGKMIIQALWRYKCEWDDQIDDSSYSDWKRWIVFFPKLPEVKIPRAYFGAAALGQCQSLQLHAFMDASDTAFACVVYLRYIDDGKPKCSLMGGKSKVAPVKVMSIPRLELQAAVLGTRLMQSILQSHQIQIPQRFMWTDSTTVLHWIHSDTRKYRPFVAFRIGEILEKTEPYEWRYVPSSENVADEATKWGHGPCFDPQSRWFQGPAFLCRAEEFWPKQSWKGVEIVTELRSVHTHRLQTPEEEIIDVRRFSKWERLLRTLAYVFKFASQSRKHSESTKLSIDQEFLLKSEIALWKMVQSEAYPNEVAVLQSHHNQKPSGAVSISSVLYKLSPMVDKDGVIRMDGRIGTAPNVPTEAKYPVILAANHPVTILFVDYYHRKFNHQNRESVVNELRQKIYVAGLRNLVKKVSSRCQWCRVHTATPSPPKMGPLPRARLEAFQRPFTCIGLDYCGPMYVKVGRSQAKRWIAVFTCLSTRAIHLEVAHSLSSVSCKMCFRRFIARRGAPAEVYSDNGTNFRGAANELQAQLQTIHNDCAESFTNTNTRWKFHPPAAPHMGGVWERLVRSIKTALASFVSMPHLPDDETFETVILEIEGMINSRPLTYIPLDFPNQEALTPNHFLLGDSNGVRQPPKEPVVSGACLRSSWDLARRMLDGFWQRWLREYLPTIARRTKWFKDTKPIEVGDLVFLADELKRNSWVRGKVIEVIPGRDGVSRQAKVDTMFGVFRRATAKLAVIDVTVKDETVSGSNPTQSHVPGIVEAIDGGPITSKDDNRADQPCASTMEN